MVSAAGHTDSGGEPRSGQSADAPENQSGAGTDGCKEHHVTPEKIPFTKETMLMTLSGRATQSQWEHPIVRDPWAEEAMRHIDYDLSKTLKGVSSRGIWKTIGPTIIASRAATFDLLTTRYLADHPDATVLQVGCGMDSRVFRVDPPAAVQWLDVDYPDVLDLRRRLFPERDGAYHQIGALVSDLHWMDRAWPTRDRRCSSKAIAKRPHLQICGDATTGVE